MAEQNQIPATKVVAEKKQNLKDSVPKGEKLLAAIGYLSFLCVLPIVLKPQSAFCQFHGKQALVLAILFFLTDMFLGSLSGVFAGMLNLLYLVIAIVCVVSVFGGKQFKIPVISDMAEKLQW